METTAVTDSPEPEPDFQAFAADPPVDPPVDPPADPPGKRQRAERKPRQKSLAHRHVETTLAIVAMSARQRTILEAALGGEHREIAELATAAIEAGPKGVVAVTSLLDVADADPIEAGILAIELTDTKAVFKTAWSVLVVLVPDLPVTPPPGPAKAGLRLAREMQGVDKSALANLRSIVSAVS